MNPFTHVQSVAAPMPDADIDTDIIFPARFLVLTQKAGLGPYAFYEKRFDEQGRERSDFVLHRTPWRGAAILVAGANFGCGSSREQAPWALADLGVRCIVAPSFGEIFQTNCFNNGMLPITLPLAEYARVLAAAQAGQTLAVDLNECSITLPAAPPIAFSIAERARQSLLTGCDEIERIRQEADASITEFELRQRHSQPWLYVDLHPND